MPHKDGPPKKRPPMSPSVLELLRKTNTLGLLDTLLQTAGVPESLAVYPQRLNRTGTYGVTVRGAQPRGPWKIVLNTTDPRMQDPQFFANVLTHEFGHFAVKEAERTRRPAPSPNAARIHERDPEAGASIFSRAVLALRAMSDTTESDRALQLAEKGMRPDMVQLYNQTELPVTRSVAELLGVDIYKQHPLQSQRERLLREATTQYVRRNR